MQRSSGHREIFPICPLQACRLCGLAPAVYVTDVRALRDLRMYQQGWRLSSRRCSVLLLRVGYLTPVVSRGLFSCPA